MLYSATRRQVDKSGGMSVDGLDLDDVCGKSPRYATQLCLWPNYLHSTKWLLPESVPSDINLPLCIPNRLTCLPFHDSDRLSTVQLVIQLAYVNGSGTMRNQPFPTTSIDVTSPVLPLCPHHTLSLLQNRTSGNMDVQASNTTTPVHTGTHRRCAEDGC